jgi:hypothetical protein
MGWVIMVAFVASAQSPKMLYGVRAVEGIIERQMTPPLGLGLKSLRKEVAIQCFKTRHGCISIPELSIRVKSLILCDGTEEMR